MILFSAQLAIRRYLACLLPYLLLSKLCVAQDASAGVGLSVNAKGILMHNGAPYRGIGVNYYDAFLRTLRDSNDDSYKEGFAQLGTHGIPFARFAAGGFRAADLQLYLSNKQDYFHRLDGVVRAAEKSHVGLIVSLFWSISAVSDLTHEPRERWADPSSQTRDFMRRYAHDVVSRYVDSPAIWGWEFSNELSLPVDMPPGRLPPEHALSYETFRGAALDFAKVVRQIDSHRILLTGNSLPRANAYHNSHSAKPSVDTEEEFGSILLRDNPGPFSPICIHASQANIGRLFADRPVSLEQLLNSCVEIGQKAGKPIYLEEFIPLPKGAPERAGTDEREYFARELAAITRSKVPIASVWMYDRKLASGPFNLGFHNQHAYMLEMIAAFDRTLQPSAHDQ